MEAVITKKKKFRSRRYKLFVWTVLAINIAHFAVFWLYVNFNSILLAFQNAVGGNEYWTTENFVWVYRQLTSGSGELRLAFTNTMKYFLFHIVIFPIGLFYAYAFFKKMPGRNFFRLMFFLPGIISGVVVSTFFKYMLQPTGPIGLLWTAFTGDTPPSFLTDERYATKVTMFYGFWTNYAGSLLVLGGALARIPPDLLESGKLDGVGWFREMWQICMPLIWPTLSIIIVVECANIFNATGEILLLSQGYGNTTTISYWLFSSIRFQSSYYRPSAFGLILTAIAIPFMLVVRWALGKVYADVEF